MEIKTISEINEYVGTSINPIETPDELFELYSVPSYDNQYPEIIKGSAIGSTKITVQENDVLICKINPRINRVWIVKHHTPYRLLASSEWIVVRNKQINPQYLQWYFSSPPFRDKITSQVAGIGGSLTRAQPKVVANYSVPIPSLHDQNKVANSLDQLERLISLRKKQLQKLDDLVKARFVEMFGDPITNPKGWKIYQLNDCLDRIENGKSFVCSDKPRASDFPAVLKLSAATYGDYRPEENKALLDENQFVEGAEVHSGDLLFTRKNTPELVGMAAYVQETPKKLMMPDLIFRLITNERMNPVFLWQLINCKEFRPIIQGISGGSAKSMSNISKERLGKIKVVCPPRQIQDQLIPFIHQIDKSKLSIKQGLEKLETLKKSLMQQCFS